MTIKFSYDSSSMSFVLTKKNIWHGSVCPYKYRDDIQTFQSNPQSSIEAFNNCPDFLYFQFFHSDNEVLSRHLLYPSYFAMHNDCLSHIHVWST